MSRRPQPWIPLLALGLSLAGGAVAATLTTTDGDGQTQRQDRTDITFDRQAPSAARIGATTPSAPAPSGGDASGGLGGAALIPVPQPSTAVLLLVGLAGLALVAGDGSRDD